MQVSELKTAVTRKDQFMSLMSHELRTPLNGIIQLSDALSRGSGGDLNAKVRAGGWCGCGGGAGEALGTVAAYLQAANCTPQRLPLWSEGRRGAAGPSPRAGACAPAPACACCCAQGQHFITTIKNSSNHLLNIINE